MKDQVSLYVLSASVLLYIIILPNIDYDLLQLINSLPVKLIFALIVIYSSTISPCISIIVLLIYVLSIQQYNTTKNIEGFTDIIRKCYARHTTRIEDNENNEDNDGNENNEDNKNNEDNNEHLKLDIHDSSYSVPSMGKLCECPEVKIQPKYNENKDPKESRNYDIANSLMFIPIVPKK